jgi:hypothetical protein
MPEPKQEPDAEEEEEEEDVEVEGGAPAAAKKKKNKKKKKKPASDAAAAPVTREDGSVPLVLSGKHTMPHTRGLFLTNDVPAKCNSFLSKFTTKQQTWPPTVPVADLFRLNGLEPTEGEIMEHPGDLNRHRGLFIFGSLHGSNSLLIHTQASPRRS